MTASRPGLYAHLPLCPARCPYCDFIARKYSPREALFLKEGLSLHLELLADSARGPGLDSLYFGGGTPSMFPAGFIAGLVEAIAAGLGLLPGAEVSLEANPGTLSPAKLKALRSAGVNRLSLGAQSFDDGLLRVLGRRHDTARTRQAFGQARRAGFENISLDLIYGLPGQSGEQALSDVRAALELGPDHVSLYELTLSPETPFGKKYRKGRPPLPDEDELSFFEDRAREALELAGLKRYEVSNFARPGLECRHNQSTWQGGDYLALGPGAHGHRAGRRWALAADADDYLRAVRSGKEPVEFREELTPEQRAAELFILGLRTVCGVDLGRVGEITGRPATEAYGPLLENLDRLGWARVEQGFLRPTGLGLDMADAAGEMFV